MEHWKEIDRINFSFGTLGHVTYVRLQKNEGCKEMKISSDIETVDRKRLVEKTLINKVLSKQLIEKGLWLME
jgi:hypothetical protein